MTTYSYAQLEGLWIQAGGPKSLAPVMAAIAEAESRGNSQAQNPSGATGLWQILGNPFPGNAYDPLTNARMAVRKEHDAHGWSPWVTYTSGAYRKYLSQGGRTQPGFGGWFGNGGSFMAHRPTYIGVGDGHGSEKVTVQPQGTTAGRGGGYVIKKVVVYGNDNVKREVMDAFKELDRELQLHHGVDDEDGDE